MPAGDRVLGENIGESARMAKERYGITEDRYGLTEDRYGIAEDRYGKTEERYGMAEERYGLTEDRYPIDLALMLEEKVCAHFSLYLLLTYFTRC